MIFRIRVLSPVHIGNGNAISPLEYFIENNSFVRIDMDKLFNDPDFIPQMRTFIDKAGFERNISKILSQNLYKKHPLYALSVHSSAKGSNPIEVREYIKSAGRVFIPGSSIKGSILSGVMETILKIKNVRELSDFRTLLGIVLNEITGSSMNEFSRWIDVRDTNFKTCEESLMLIQSRVVGSKTNKALPVHYEALKPEIEFDTEIIWRGKRKFDNPEKAILALADKFYRKIYEKEYNSSIKPPVIPENAFLLRVGQGSSAWATSFLLLAEELGIKNYDIKRPNFHRVKGPPTTRKLVSGSIPMGWVAISCNDKT